MYCLPTGRYSEDRGSTSFSLLLRCPPWSCFFFLNDPAPTEFYPLPLPAALPICHGDTEELVVFFQERGEPPRRDHPLEASLTVHDRHRATPLGEQDHAFAHRTIGKQGRQVL